MFSRLAVYDEGKTKRVHGHDWSNLKSEQRHTTKGFLTISLY